MNAHPTGLPENSQAVATSRSRVLVAEDDPMVRKILQRWLQQWNHEVIAVDNGAAAWKVLQQTQPPKLLILDWMMPEIEGLELCRRVRADQRSAYRYILLITAKDARQDLVSAFEAGADDYLTKPFDCDELRARLRVGERILKLQDDLIRARDALQFQATHDVLTGLWNRGAVLDVFSRELERCRRTRVPMAVLMLDLDHFKRINDTHGHLAGDAVLKETANRLTRAVRSYDYVGRYGGEEFLVVLPGCSCAQAVRIAERIRSRIAQDPVGAGAAGIQLTASIGGRWSLHKRVPRTKYWRSPMALFTRPRTPAAIGLSSCRRLFGKLRVSSPLRIAQSSLLPPSVDTIRSGRALNERCLHLRRDPHSIREVRWRALVHPRR